MEGNSGLQQGYSKDQWGPWKSHALLTQTAVQDLGWQDRVQLLSVAFKEFSSQERPGLMARDEFDRLMAKYQCCDSVYNTTFFDLFDRNNDGFLSEADFVGGFLAVSPHTPHQISTPAGQLLRTRMNNTF